MWTLLHGAVSGWYPYPFLDVSELGYPRTLLNIAGLVLAFLVLELALVGIGRLHARGAGKSRHSLRNCGLPFIARQGLHAVIRGMADFDAIAVGGGLAGAAFALELARSGARVALMERTRAPTLKVCGDFLSSGGAGAARPSRPRCRGHGRRRASPRCGSSPASALRTPSFRLRAAGLSRLALDEALIGKAAAAGAEMIRGRSRHRARARG